jgi:hypothetical protein
LSLWASLGPNLADVAMLQAKKSVLQTLLHQTLDLEAQLILA